MKIQFRYFFLLGIVFLSFSLQAQNSNFDPYKLKAEYFKNKDVKDGLLFDDQKGNAFKIKNSEYSRGLYIKKDGKWLKHGVFYSMTKGRVRAKTMYSYGKKHGAYESYHSNGKIQFQYNNKNNLKEGKWYQYRNDGSLFEEKVFKNGQIHGTKISYHLNGEKNFVSTYVNGKKHGERLQYNNKGKLIGRSQFNMGKKVGKTQWLY